MPPADDTPPRDAAEVEEDVAAPFGSQEPTRVAADVSYRGRVGEHDYLVRVRHRLLDTSFTVEIDGVAHDPKAEEKARQASKKAAGPGTAPDEKTPDDATDEANEDDEPETADAPEGPDGADGSDEAEGAIQADAPEKRSRNPPAGKPAPPDDGLRFRLEEHVTTLYCTVRRPDEDGDPADAEVITVRTAGLGGAGEVDVRQGLTRRPLAPDEGSPSAARDRKRTAHPTRYALLAALTKAAAFLLPLLGLGALFSGILQPVREWVAERMGVVIEAIMGVVDPVLEWVDGLLHPIREFLDSLTRPIRDLIAAVLQPLRDLVDWLRSLLPELSLPFDVPDWVVDIAVPVVIVLVVFALTFARLRRRRERLEAARASAATPSEKPAPNEPPQRPSEEPLASADEPRTPADGQRTPAVEQPGATADEQPAAASADEQPAVGPGDVEHAADPDEGTECSSPP